jgi:hypothetical protein
MYRGFERERVMLREMGRCRRRRLLGGYSVYNLKKYAIPCGHEDNEYQVVVTALCIVLSGGMSNPGHTAIGPTTA